ncbi:hypothetical protein Bhyg_15387 [Pseudolycoriella hygida]|uniref:Uncharacterized protein n=1 Tax=Pseudolycoriella hygida TaxID=35572 RepID=A0A9Q0RY09_9DIPT|nr:hypothetical protein Bhyg_15387 [Pseudolycoriella hygida]
MFRAIQMADITCNDFKHKLIIQAKYRNSDHCNYLYTSTSVYFNLKMARFSGAQQLTAYKSRLTRKTTSLMAVLGHDQNYCTSSANMCGKRYIQTVRNRCVRCIVVLKAFAIRLPKNLWH